MLFLASVIVAILFFVVEIPNPKNEFVRVIIFCVLYFAQFLLNLDPPLSKKKAAEKEKEDEEDKDYQDYDDDDDDFDDDDDEDEDEDDDEEESDEDVVVRRK